MPGFLPNSILLARSGLVRCALLRSVEPVAPAASVNMSATLKLPKRRGGGSENFRAGDHFDCQSIQGYLENGVIAGDSSSFAKQRCVT